MRMYRGKRVDGKGWVEGHHCIIEGKHYIIPDDAEIVEERMNPTIQGFVEVIPSSVGQSIGKEDESGEKMYKGDIVEAVGQEVVKITDSYRKMKAGIYNFVIFWSEPFSGWEFKHPIGSIHPDIGLREYKIIGNTTDNPELVP